MKITEKNFPKVADRIYRMRQHWRRRVKVGNVVQYVATVAFFVFSLLWACHMLPVWLAENLAQKDLGFTRYIADGWDLILNLCKAPQDPAAQVWAGIPCVFALSFLAAAVAAVIVALRYKPEPKKKEQLKHSVLSGMVTGIKIYQERIGLFENFASYWSNILSPVFAVCVVGLAAYLFGINGLFETETDTFISIAIYGLLGSCIAHRVASFLLTLPVALL